MNTVLRKACALCFSFHPSLPLLPSLCRFFPCASETLLCLSNNCCARASTSPPLPQTTRWLCHIQRDGLNTTSPFFFLHSFLSFFFLCKLPARLEESQVSQPRTKGKFTGKVQLSCRSWMLEIGCATQKAWPFLFQLRWKYEITGHKVSWSLNSNAFLYFVNELIVYSLSAATGASIFRWTTRVRQFMGFGTLIV